MGEPALVKDFINTTKIPDGDIGLELEVEAHGQLPSVNTTWWGTKTEPSLRGGGLEYITKGALPIDGLMLKRIQALTTTIDTKESRVDKDSHRTSVHVHHKVANYTPVQLWTAITGYWLLENILFKACGEERLGNHFCLRLKDAEVLLLKYVADELKDISYPFSTLDTDNVRYSGINLNAIRRFGSVELRGMRGTVDPQIINDWSLLTNGVLFKAKDKFRSPEALLDYYFHNGPTNLINSLWTETKSFEYLKTDRDASDLIDENALRLANVMYEPSWEAYTKIVDKLAENLKTKPKKKKQDMWGPDSSEWRQLVAPNLFSSPSTIIIDD